MLGPHHRLRHLLILLLVIVGILVILPIVAPKPRRGGGTYEMAVIRALAMINTAQTQYFSIYGRYATSLTELGPPTAGDAAAASAADLITAGLAAGVKSGY